MHVRRYAKSLHGKLSDRDWVEYILIALVFTNFRYCSLIFENISNDNAIKYVKLSISRRKYGFLVGTLVRVFNYVSSK